MSYQDQDEQIWNNTHHSKNFNIDGLFDRYDTDIDYEHYRDEQI